MKEFWSISAIGESHIKMNVPNQDYCAFAKFKNGGAIAVSDGLGSKKHSDFGSKMACKAVIKSAKIYNEKYSIEELLKNIHANWLKLIKSHSAYDCGATCLFAILYKNKVIIGQLGDGAVVGIGKTRENSFLLGIKESSFSNITNCLTKEFNKELWKIKIADKTDLLSVILYTDGISESIVPQMQVDFARELYYGHKYYKQNKRLKKLKEMLFNWKESSDDKTLGCLCL